MRPDTPPECTEGPTERDPQRVLVLVPVLVEGAGAGAALLQAQAALGRREQPETAQPNVEALVRTLWRGGEGRGE